MVRVAADCAGAAIVFVVAVAGAAGRCRRVLVAVAAGWPGRRSGASVCIPGTAILAGSQLRAACEGSSGQLWLA